MGMAITRALQQVIESEFQLPLPQETFVIAPNGAEPERYQDLPEPSAARRQLNLADKITAVYTGHFYAGRGLNLLLELAGLDVAESLKFLLSKDHTVKVRCAYGDFDVKDGQASSQLLVFDTSDTVVFGEESRSFSGWR